MRSLGIRLPILAVTAWAGIGLSVSAMGYRYGETMYLTPTVATYGWPTSYSGSAYYLPTAYSSFPSYMPTSYAYEPAAVTSTYLTTGYRVRRGLFGRLRLVERPVLASYATSYMPTTYFAPSYYTTSYRAASYVPTIYAPTIYRPTVYAPTVYRPTVYTPTDYSYSPTVWETSYVSSSGWDCDQVAWNTPAAVAPSRSYDAPAQAYTPPSSNASGQTVQRETDLEPAGPASGASPAANEAPLSSAVRDKPRPATGTDASSPPEAPAAKRQQNTVQPSTGGQGSTPATQKTDANAPANAKPLPPAAPSGDPTEIEVKPAPIDNNGTNRRESLRPSSYVSRPTLELRNVLIGRVESDAGEPLGEVPISAINRDNSAVRRAGMTDAFGRFAIRLADGEWTVNVRTPSGRVFPVRSVTVSNGKVMDNQEGREVRNLIISY